MPSPGALSGTFPLARKIDSMVAELDGRQAWSKLLAAAKYANKHGVAPVLNADTGGDGLMSNWWREGSGRKQNRRPIPIVTIVRSVGQFQVSVEPAARSRGPWRVLEEGRKANSGGSSYVKGHSKKGRVPKSLDLGNGMRLYRRTNRGASRSRPKYTWTKATAAMAPLAAYMGRSQIEDVFLRIWQRGQGASTMIGPSSANVLRSGINSPGKDTVGRTRGSVGMPRHGGYSTWTKPVPWGCEAPVTDEQWVIRWGGREWSEDDLLVGHLMLMVEGHGEDTWDVAPVRGPRRLLCTLAALISIENDLQYEQVVAALLQEPASRLLQALQLIDSE